MYLFINENEIEEYNQEILKRYVGSRLIKTIANPTEEDLREFGYMSLVEQTLPEYNPETQYLQTHYSVVDNDIYKTYTVEDIPTEDTTTEIEENIEG